MVFGLLSKTTLPYLAFGFLVLGCGMLYKHFVIVPFISMFGYFLWKGPRRWIFPLTTIFFLPLILFAIYFYSKGKDPLFWLDSPIKSAQEWDRHYPKGPFPKEKRWEVLKNQVTKKNRWQASKMFANSGKNIVRFWRPNRFVLNRVEKYHGFKFHAFLRFITVTAYLSVLFLGVWGIVKDFGSFFMIYVAGNVLLVTFLGCFVYLVARYHVPFIFMFVLYTGALLKSRGNPDLD